MKKVIAALLIALFVIVGCQEGSSLVAPQDNSELEKKSAEIEIIESAQDTSVVLPNSPIVPRI